MSTDIAAVVNGEEIALAPEATVADVVARFCPSPQGIAVALNGEVVPKSLWSSASIASGDRLEVLGAAPGG